MTVEAIAPVSVAAPFSPAWWVGRLHQQMRARQPEIDLCQRYVDGAHDDPTVEARASRAFRRILGLSKTNLTGLIVEATAERMAVQGFRFGDQPEADGDAWAVWQASDFDAESELAITAALTVGRSYVLVEPPQGDGLPRLYAEDASQVIVAYAPGRRQERLAALKLWVDEWTADLFATLYLPGSLHKFRADAPRGGVTNTTPQWGWRTPGLEGEPNPMGEVPIFELQNRPSLKVGTARSEVIDVLSDQDRANHIALNSLIAAEYGAFRQKWATGIEVPRDENGNAVEPFDVAVNRILISENDQGRFGDFNATDLKPYIDLYESTVRHMAAVTRTPASYMLGHMANLSAEALAAAEAGLVKKVERRRRHFEQPFEAAMRLAFRAMGDPRGSIPTVETVWEDAEIRSHAQAADAAVKLVQSAVIAPQTAQEKYLGMGETERQRDENWRRENDVLGGFDATLNAQAAGFPPDL